MTITFLEYREALRGLPKNYPSDSHPIWKVPLRPRHAMAIGDPIPELEQLRVLSFKLCRIRHSDGKHYTEEYYWEPQATIVPCSE